MALRFWAWFFHTLLPPTTEPSPATEYPATASTPWEATTPGSKDRTIEWICTSRRIIGYLEAISVTSVASGWHSTETSTSSRHGSLSPWTSSIKSWHKHPSFLDSPPCLLHIESTVPGRNSAWVKLQSQEGYLNFRSKNWNCKTGAKSLKIKKNLLY